MDDRTSVPAAVVDVVSDEAGLRGLYKPPMELAVLSSTGSTRIAATFSRIRRSQSSARRGRDAALT